MFCFCIFQKLRNEVFPLHLSELSPQHVEAYRLLEDRKHKHSPETAALYLLRQQHKLLVSLLASVLLTVCQWFWCLKGSYNATCTFASCLNWNVCCQCVYTQPPYNEKNILKSLPLSQIEPSVCVTSHRRRPLPQLLIDRSVSAQTALVSYLRPALSELSSVVSPPEQM